MANLADPWAPTPECNLLVFAKAPIPGYAKTRLIPALGADGAAQLAEQLLKHTVEEAVKAQLGPVTLVATPDASHPAWPLLVQRQGLHWMKQSEGDLGKRMSEAARALDQCRPTLIIGTDCPGLNADILRQAAQSLASHHACMVPVSDGGYSLIGFRRFNEGLFQNIAWSTPEVARQTRQQCLRLGWSLAELPMLHDIDEPGDLRWLPKHIKINKISSSSGLDSSRVDPRQDTDQVFFSTVKDC